MRKYSAFLIGALFLVVPFSAVQAEPVLTIQQDGKSKSFTRTGLLSMHTYQLDMNNSVGYEGKDMHYTAVRVCDLLKPLSVNSDETVELVSSDNFYALVPAKYLINCKEGSSIAYVAIEPADNPWPQLPRGGTAGPFFVVWTNPEKDYISSEYWAWNVVRMNVIAADQLTGVIPAPQNVKQEIKNGYHVYVSRCSGCHTMNQIGKAEIGPDLNYPMSPTKYFASDAILKKFIRDPQSVRIKKHDEMGNFTRQYLSDKDLDDLIAYMHYMDENR